MRLQTLLACCFISVTLVSGSTPRGVGIETKPLDELYKDAIAEGGDLIVKAGGDEKNQRDEVIQAFRERFPKINLNLTVDLSKYHDSVIDRSFNLTGKAGADIAQLQTLQDFVRWRGEGKLLAYKPAGFDHIPDNIKDVNGFYVGTNYFLFANNFATAKLTKAEAPTEFLDYLEPRFKGKIVSTYPNDDDAALFQFFKIVQTHGWEAIFKFLNQDVQFVRGTATPIAVMLQSNNSRSVTFTSGPGFTNGSTGFFQQLPRDDFSHIVIWAQRAAIFKTAEHPAAAKLFLNFLLTKEQQVANGGFSVRDDVPPQAGLKPLSAFAGKLDPPAFERFMLNRPVVERFKLQFEQLIGTAQGISPLDDDL
ncbi:hypothetical protein QCA50_015108 [Cerrena zonata]|uniref:Uncharacterized protein n=1 Tax=Cerrena zonata TaxID=2478898 RepID=A0AAW0FLW0_9APHY